MKQVTTLLVLLVCIYLEYAHAATYNWGWNKFQSSTSLRNKRHVTSRSSAVESWPLLCDELCGAGFGWPACGSRCNREIIVNRNTLNVSSFCPILCEYGLGGSHCVCSTTRPKERNRKYDKVCDEFCMKKNLTVRGCSRCEKSFWIEEYPLNATLVIRPTAATQTELQESETTNESEITESVTTGETLQEETTKYGTTIHEEDLNLDTDENETESAQVSNTTSTTVTATAGTILSESSSSILDNSTHISNTTSTAGNSTTLAVSDTSSSSTISTPIHTHSTAATSITSDSTTKLSTPVISTTLTTQSILPELNTTETSAHPPNPSAAPTTAPTAIETETPTSTPTTTITTTSPAHTSTSTTVPSTTPNWDEFCQNMCAIGEGGGACRCDLLPLAAD